MFKPIFYCALLPTLFLYSCRLHKQVIIANQPYPGGAFSTDTVSIDHNKIVASHLLPPVKQSVFPLDIRVFYPGMGTDYEGFLLVLQGNKKHLSATEYEYFEMPALRNYKGFLVERIEGNRYLYYHLKRSNDAKALSTYLKRLISHQVFTLANEQVAIDQLERDQVKQSNVSVADCCTGGQIEVKLRGKYRSFRLNAIYGFSYPGNPGIAAYEAISKDFDDLSTYLSKVAQSQH